MENTTNYSKVRFIAYAIPTTPANLVSFDNSLAVAGTYLGDAQTADDIAGRVDILKNAVQFAKAQLPAEPAQEVLNVFVAPEFFFHGSQGPYLWKLGDGDPVDLIEQRLSQVFPFAEYPDWLFLFGTAVSSQVDDFSRVSVNPLTTVRNSVVRTMAEQWNKSFGPMKSLLQELIVRFIGGCRINPSITVQNRAILASSIPLSVTGGNGTQFFSMSTEKAFASYEDFVLYDPKGTLDIVTEQMVSYPSIDLTDGDVKKDPNDKRSIFQQSFGAANNPPFFNYGVEVCLDHFNMRLRSNLGNEVTRATALTGDPIMAGGVQIQLIPSCGVTLSSGGIAASVGGFAFNVDGQIRMNSKIKAGTPAAGTNDNEIGLICAYVDYANSAPQSSYAAHSQLAQVARPAKGPNPMPGDPGNAVLTAIDLSLVQAFDVTAAPELNLDRYFAGGAGAVHIYGPYASPR